MWCQYEICNLHGFHWEKWESECPRGKMKVVPGEAITLPSSLTILTSPKGFLGLCLILVTTRLLIHCLKTNRSEVNGWFLQFMTVIGGMIPKVVVVSSQSHRRIIPIMLFCGWDFSRVAPYAHKYVVCLVCHSPPKALRRGGSPQWAVRFLHVRAQVN